MHYHSTAIFTVSLHRYLHRLLLLLGWVLELGYMPYWFVAPVHQIFLAQLVHAPEYKLFVLDLDAHLEGPVVEAGDELFVVGLALLDLFEPERRYAEEFFSDGIVDGDPNGATVVSQLHIGVVLERHHVGLALEAFLRIDIDLLLAQLAHLKN